MATGALVVGLGVVFSCFPVLGFDCFTLKPQERSKNSHFLPFWNQNFVGFYDISMFLRMFFLCLQYNMNYKDDFLGPRSEQADGSLLLRNAGLALSTTTIGLRHVVTSDEAARSIRRILG